VNGTLFKSFLRLGVEYSGLLQNNLYSQSRNNQWGFDISTYSKRFPTVYLSYKPFSTFRSFDDTLSIAQKPILGSVWSGRVNYQFRRNGHAWRTVLFYNRNNSLSDTQQYTSELLQLTASYTLDKTTLNINIGSSHINTNVMPVAYPLFNNTTYLDLMAGVPLSKAVYIAPSVDIAKNKAGICRYGVSSALSLNLKKLPFSIRTMFRYNTYKLEESVSWKNMIAASLDLTWRFHFKLYDY
jgi:hypothetical protein